MKSSRRALQAGASIPAAALLVLSLLAGGCLTVPPSPLPAAEKGPVAEPGVLRVRLHFGAEADLDLHVTDPRLETVYFGNNPSLGGGALEEDLRCESPPPRIESVRFAEPAPGRYRVGVAFAARCARVRQAVPYRIEVEAPGLRLEQSGEVSPGHFEQRALEFEWTEPGLP